MEGSIGFSSVERLPASSAYELKQIAGSGEPDVDRLVEAVGRLRTRVKPAAAAPTPPPATKETPPTQAEA